MYEFNVKLRVRYAETDQMGYCYYGNYAQYFEVGRVELLRSLGISYKKIEEMGFALPVVNFNINYKAPALYDDEVIIKTIVKEIPTAKITFNYETFNNVGDLLNIGEVVLVFVNRDTKKPCIAPDIIKNKFIKVLQ